MSTQTSFKLGGNADFLASPENTEELCEIIKLCKNERVPFFVMGNGSDLLVSDKGIRGVTVKLAKSMCRIDVTDGIIVAEAGALLSAIAAVAYENALTGFEFASGIPGTLGGAVLMNAGAYGGEMKDVIKEVSYLDEDGTIKTVTDCRFSYRHSMFAEGGKVILSARIQLQKGDRKIIKMRTDELSMKRREKQPINFPSAGSTFKRPENGYAAQIIEEAGLKGRSVGGAEVSEKHAGFIINKGNATATDVAALMDIVTETVFKNTGVTLSPEVQKVGEW